MRVVSGFAIAVLFFTTPLAAAPTKPKSAAEQMAFGVQMARRNLWNEAFFRFQQASALEPSNPRILNNLGVASEARGRFDEALKYYQEALRLAGGDSEIRRNYARFVEFYQSFKPAPEGDAAAADASGNTQSQGGDR
jgi:Flp pilus assembly protein TadD